MTTVPGTDEAARLAGLLLQERLAACVQEIPIVGRYPWEGAIRDEREILLLVKTPKDRSPAAVARIERARPCELPEVLAFQAAGGSDPYLAWLTAETRPGPAGD